MDLSLLSNLDIVHLIDTGGIIPALFIALLTYLVMRFTRFGLIDSEKTTTGIV